MKTRGRQLGSRVKLKPVVLPPGFILVIDTGEQKPFFVRPPKGLTIVRDNLKPYACDYSVRGFEAQIGVERKQHSDLLSYIGKERRLTEAKLETLREYYFSALVVEGITEADLYAGDFFGSILTVNHFRGFLTAVNVTYRTHTFFCRDRNECERWLLERLVRAYNELRKV